MSLDFKKRTISVRQDDGNDLEKAFKVLSDLYKELSLKDLERSKKIISDAILKNQDLFQRVLKMHEEELCSRFSKLFPYGSQWFGKKICEHIKQLIKK